jgi:hypothetical protein
MHPSSRTASFRRSAPERSTRPLGDNGAGKVKPCLYE